MNRRWFRRSSKKQQIREKEKEGEERWPRLNVAAAEKGFSRFSVSREGRDVGSRIEGGSGG